jgi:hypothetical protein
MGKKVKLYAYGIAPTLGGYAFGWDTGKLIIPSITLLFNTRQYPTSCCYSLLFLEKEAKSIGCWYKVAAGL